MFSKFLIPLVKFLIFHICNFFQGISLHKVFNKPTTEEITNI